MKVATIRKAHTVSACKKAWADLERIRTKFLACPDHPNGKCEAYYHPASRSWMVHWYGEA